MLGIIFDFLVLPSHCYSFSLTRSFSLTCTCSISLSSVFFSRSITLLVPYQPLPITFIPTLSASFLNSFFLSLSHFNRSISLRPFTFLFSIFHSFCLFLISLFHSFPFFLLFSPLLHCFSPSFVSQVIELFLFFVLFTHFFLSFFRSLYQHNFHYYVLSLLFFHSFSSSLWFTLFFSLLVQAFSLVDSLISFVLNLYLTFSFYSIFFTSFVRYL